MLLNRRTQRIVFTAAYASAIASAACSASDERNQYGSSAGARGVGGASDAFGGLGSGGTAGGQPSLILKDGGLTGPFRAHIEHGGVNVTFLTVACEAGCADVVAIANGGNAPYTFIWEDGSSGAARRVCPAEAATYEVAVTDTGTPRGEFRRDPETVRAALTAQLLRCPGDGGTPSESQLCLLNPSFEGTAVITEFGGFTAPPWSICDPPGSPDIKNASQGWSVPGPEPSNGATYLNMLWWRELWVETVGSPLCEPLVAGKQYSFKVDLSWQGWIEGVTAGHAEFWASHALCGEEQLLWTSPVVESTWRTYCVTFTADQSFTFLKLKPTGLRTGVLVDNITPVARCVP